MVERGAIGSGVGQGEGAPLRCRARRCRARRRATRRAAGAVGRDRGRAPVRRALAIATTIATVVTSATVARPPGSALGRSVRRRLVAAADVRIHQPLRHQHRQRLLRRLPVRPVDLAVRRRLRLSARGQPGRAGLPRAPPLPRSRLGARGSAPRWSGLQRGLRRPVRRAAAGRRQPVRRRSSERRLGGGRPASGRRSGRRPPTRVGSSARATPPSRSRPGRSRWAPAGTTWSAPATSGPKTKAAVLDLQAKAGLNVVGYHRAEDLGGGLELRCAPAPGRRGADAHLHPADERVLRRRATRPRRRGRASSSFRATRTATCVFPTSAGQPGLRSDRNRLLRCRPPRPPSVSLQQRNGINPSGIIGHQTWAAAWEGA